MTDTVQGLATETKTTVEFLLRKIKQAGLSQTQAADSLSQQDKQKIKAMLDQPKKTLSRRSPHERGLGQRRYTPRYRDGQKRTTRPHEKIGYAKDNQGKPKENFARKGSGSTFSSQAGKAKKVVAGAQPRSQHRSKQYGTTVNRSGTATFVRQSRSALAPHKAKADAKSKERKPKHTSTKEILAREDKALKRYGIRISPEEAMEMEEIKKKERVRDVHKSSQSNFARTGVRIQNVHKFIKPTKQIVKSIKVEDAVGVSQLAHQMGMKTRLLIQKIKKLGFSYGADDSLEKETALLVIEELGHRAIDGVRQQGSPFEQPLPAHAVLVPRPPLVTVMGHVDHGKTTLLDFIRKAKQVDKEAGQITQHLGAYRVEVKGRRIVFFDTPGHAAFTEMRKMGAHLTDIVILVVAADDSIMPQTREAIEHIQAAKVPVIVAINKMDKEGADAEKVRKEVATLGLLPESWGGEVSFTEISALNGTGVDALLESVLVQADIMELKAAIDVTVRGRVIESRLDKNMGPIGVLLVSHGILKKGDVVCTEEYYGPVRMMFNDIGKLVQEARPGDPVEVLGMNGVPQSGSRFAVFPSEKEARVVVEGYAELKQNSQSRQRQGIDLETFMEAKKQAVLTINLIIKTDVTGSSEAIKKLISELENEETKFNIVAQSVGAIKLTDVHLARTTDSFILGFNVRADNEARKALKENQGIQVHYFSVIYELAEELQRVVKEKSALHGTEKIIGIATVKEVFSTKIYGQIAGSEVVEGIVYKNKPIRVLRDNTVIYEGSLESLRRFKEDVLEVHAGIECGIGVKGYRNVKVGDQIEVYDKRAL